MPSHVNLRKDTGADYEAIKEVTGMTFSEIAARSTELLVKSLTSEQRLRVELINEGGDIEMPCLECGKMKKIEPGSHEHIGVFNVFCDARCEDKFAWKL